MKKIIAFYFALIFMCLSVFANDPQPMPQNTDLALHDKHIILLEVRALQVVENKNHNGVYATYREIFTPYKPSKLSKNSGSSKSRKPLGLWKVRATGWSSQTNDNHEKIFIVGLDHDIITTNGIIYHEKNGAGQHFLMLWPIGIEKLHNMKTGQEIRLKKFTVNPQEAFEYYKTKRKR